MTTEELLKIIPAAAHKAFNDLIKAGYVHHVKTIIDAYYKIREAELLKTEPSKTKIYYIQDYL